MMLPAHLTVQKMLSLAQDSVPGAWKLAAETVKYLNLLLEAEKLFIPGLSAR